MRTIRDEQRENVGKVTIDDVTCTKETDRAILCLVGTDEVWVPQSQVDDDSEVYAKGHSGKLIVTAWFAEKQGWL